METATGPGVECAHVTVSWPMKSCRQMSPGDLSENKKKSYYHCTVIIITSIWILVKCKVRIVKSRSDETRIEMQNGDAKWLVIREVVHLNDKKFKVPCKLSCKQPLLFKKTS